LRLLYAAPARPLGIDPSAPQIFRPMSSNPPRQLSPTAAVPPSIALDLLFIHHSVGGQLLADPGPLETTPDARRSIHRTHPNGGGLRSLLAKQGFRVHEASYGSAIGQKTDLFDWLPKFSDSMPQILALEHQDEKLGAGVNQVVMFKSCYPNNAFRPDAGAVGNPRGPDLTLANAKATLLAVRGELARHPATLFVYLSAPPLRADPPEPAWKRLAKRALRRPTRADEQHAAASLAREFNDWVVSPSGWLAAYPHTNILTFDYFGLLAGDRASQSSSNFLQYASNDGTDNHPHADAQSRAAQALASLLERAMVNRATRRNGVSV
jgi:hypothetical protein